MSKYVVSRYGMDIDLSKQGHTGCPKLHGNTHIPNYNNNPYVVKIYRERKTAKKEHYLWKLEIRCEDCGSHYTVWEHIFKKQNNNKCRRCKLSRNLEGIRFCRLTVTKESYFSKGNRFWLCNCDCGKQTTVRARNLPKTQSCGCLSKEKFLDGIQSRRMVTKEYSDNFQNELNIWYAMKSRCFDTNNKRYNDYGGRGITVCERWKNSFENFVEDMGKRPSKKHSIERVNNNGDYEPNNCIWEISSKQMSNRRVSKNKSGRIGVSFCNSTSKWRVRLRTRSVDKWFGRYESFNEACEVIEKAELELLGYSRKEGFIK